MSDSAVDDLDVFIVAEIRETWGESGHLVRSALDLDEDFTATGGPQSELSRAKIGRAFERGARKSKLFRYQVGPGGSKEAFIIENGRERIVRLLKATLNAEGEIVIRAKDRSMLESLEPTILGPQERWVLGYVLEGDGVAQIFTAQVTDVEEGNPGRLILGPVTYLAGSTLPGPSDGFRSDSEDLNWGDDENEVSDEESA